MAWISNVDLNKFFAIPWVASAKKTRSERWTCFVKETCSFRCVANGMTYFFDSGTVTGPIAAKLERNDVSEDFGKESENPLVSFVCDWSHFCQFS